MNSRYALYFLLATLPYIAQQSAPPVSGWDWFKFGAAAIAQGLLAIKALQSSPTGSLPITPTSSQPTTPSQP